MKPTCFFTVYDEKAKEMAEGMVRSVKRFYPDITFIEKVIDHKELNGVFDLRNYCDHCNQEGLRLLDEYQRVIYIDPDHIMCAPCPDLFGDFDLGVVENNISVGAEHGGITNSVYLNNGMVVCTSKEAWQDYVKAFDEFNGISFSTLNHQNALNKVVHSLKYNVKLLEFDDRTYGIRDQDFYKDMYLKNGELYIDVVKVTGTKTKKLCLFHAAGLEWKEVTPSIRLRYETSTNTEAMEKLRSFTL